VDCSIPQGSVLGTVKFVAYTEDIVDVADKHRVRSHFYADDSQIYDRCRPQDVSGMRDRLSGCVTNVSCWCASRCLQLNATKTEAVWFGTWRKLDKLHDQDRHVQIDSEIILLSLSFVISSCTSTMNYPWSSMWIELQWPASSTYIVCDRYDTVSDGIWRCSWYSEFITTRLDYCNSVLAGLPQITLAPLQRIQNAAAGLVFKLRGCEHVTPSLIQLHWLPVRWRIYFKLCTIMHAVHTCRCPAYLQEIVHTVSSTTARPGLRSAVSTDHVVETYEVRQTRLLLHRSSRVEFSSSTRPRRDGLLSC